MDQVGYFSLNSKPQVDVDHNGKVDLREFIDMMHEQVTMIMMLIMMMFLNDIRIQ